MSGRRLLLLLLRQHSRSFFYHSPCGGPRIFLSNWNKHFKGIVSGEKYGSLAYFIIIHASYFLRSSRFFNPYQSGILANSKRVACWYFNTNWYWSFNTNYPMPRLWYCKKRQKRLTLRAWLRYLENSDQCIKSWFWFKNWGQSL